MCTALTLKTEDFYFGRTLDLDSSYAEEVSVVPRNMPLVFRKKPAMSRHYAMIGMATAVGDMPLFYDASNEFGLSMAGLNFPENACYFEEKDDCDNITPFEFIPWILGQCKDLSEARAMLDVINLVDIPFSESLKNAPLHWIIADKDGALVVESMTDGVHIHENTVGVMTNNPPFDYHMFNLNNYRTLRVDNGNTPFSEQLGLSNYCQGLGAVGLPGDVSSMSRFVRAVFGRECSVCKKDENSSVSQFFHILGSVSMNRGVCMVPSGNFDITVYTSCINTAKGLYYYTTYDNQRISLVDMHKCNLEEKKLFRFPLVSERGIYYVN